MLDDDDLFIDDDDMPVSNSVSKFLDKIVYNVLCKRRHKNVSDDLFFNNVKDHETILHGSWRAIYNARYREYREYRDSLQGVERDSISRYFLPSDFLKEDDISQIMAKMVETCPWVKEEWVLSPHTKVVAELLDIDYNETLILNLALALPTMDYSHRDIFERMMYNEDFRIPSRCYSVLLGIPENNIQKSLNGFLMSSGFLVASTSPKGLHTIDPILADAFTNPSLTRDSIETFLFPSNITTELTIGDYEHLLKELSITESIINKGLERETVGMNVMLWGLPGCGKTEVAIVLAKKNNWNLKIIGDISAGDNQEKSRAQRITSLRVAMKLYSRNKDTVLLFDEMEDLFRGQKNDNFSKAFVNRIIETTKTPIIWTTNSLKDIGSAVLRRMVYNVCFEIPPVAARRTMWKNYNDKYDLKIDDKVLNNLAETYDMVPALINNAAKITSMSGIPTDQIPDVLSSLDTLMNFGEKRRFDDKPMEREYAPYDTHLSNTDIDLKKLADQLEKAKPGWSMCCYGAPGTGKSHYGRYIAERLGKKIIIKRASDILGMYVGENEKNIRDAFKEAKNEGRILLIDEGDTFLRSRKLARQSWEASMTNEMLTQMESHDQPFILTTNLMDDLDEAAMRRFTFKVKFDFVTPDQSKILFRSFFGLTAPDQIETNYLLAPGDFAAVKHKVDILGVTDPNEIYTMLEAECALKPQKGKPIGFSKIVS